MAGRSVRISIRAFRHVWRQAIQRECDPDMTLVQPKFMVAPSGAASREMLALD
tara:strand:- start:284 stop:442 length:159 start_codon:yes stop_codon:yes gene_type:complete